MTTAIAGYAYTFKAPPSTTAQAYISPTSSSSSSNLSINGGTSTNKPNHPAHRPSLDRSRAVDGCRVRVPGVRAHALGRQRAHPLLPPLPRTASPQTRQMVRTRRTPNNAGYAVLSFTCTGAAAAALARDDDAQLGAAVCAQLGATGGGGRHFVRLAVVGKRKRRRGSGPAGSNSRNATSGSGSGSGSDAADLGASDYSGGSVGGGGGGEVVSPTSPLFPVAGTVGATHAGGMGGAGFGQQQLQGQGQGQSGVGMGMGIGYQGVGGGGMGVGAGGAMGAMGGVGGMGTAAEAAYLKEYSIFVGDLAPETSNSDLVTVFRNPVLGLRNDRAPKFIRPFASCKSAKIMLDPVTGFMDEADQQRALIEMHGLYCLSRPMRISPATAKFKPPQADGVSPATLSTSASAPPCPRVSAPIAASYYPGGGDAVAYAPGGGVTSATGGGTGAEYFAQQYGVGVPQQQAQARAREPGEPHRAERGAAHQHGPVQHDCLRRRAVAAGWGETLRTFFVPFGELHYVKVPVGKRCGFVQFVRKADAERAIEKMQGFPVGGSQIRLSWGRSQYKAAQAAAQAAQAAAMAQAQPPAVVQAPVVVLRQQAGASSGNGNDHSRGGNAITPAMLEGMTHEQAVMLLQKFQMQDYAVFSSALAYAPPAPASNAVYGYSGGVNGGGGGNANASGSYSVGAPNGSGGNTIGAEAYRNGFHTSSPSNGNVSVSEAYDGGEGKACFTNESLKVRRGEEVEPFGYPQRGACKVPASASGSSSHSATTSSFSPFSPDPTQHQLYGHGHGHQHQQSQHQGQGPIGGLYVDRYTSHVQTQPILRPNSGSARSIGGGGGVVSEFDVMHDLNGTLGSLDLDCKRDPDASGSASLRLGSGRGA
ncbi:hypothetical protein B0H14DRAFT_3568718 [Mycena olivaceomarginata]|nr:hypothetical protein B0H14DRAFT_3568718 [Mycena olivaceomarginata]